MKVDLGIWGKLSWVFNLIILVAGIIFVVGKYLPLINQNERMRQEILKLTTENQQEENDGKKLKAAIDALEHDPKTVERLAREKLGYAKTGEIIIRFEDNATNSAGH